MGEPFRVQVQRRGQVEDVPGGLLQVGQGGLAAQQYGAGVDLMHQVEALELQVRNASQLDGACVVHRRIDTAEMLIGLGQGLMHGNLVTHVHLQGQRPATGGLDFLGNTVNRPRQLGVRLGTLGGNHDIGAIARGAQGNLATNPTTGASNEQGFALQ
ncbi:hypothetical protein D3C73_1282360 [compost metagenome]